MHLEALTLRNVAHATDSAIVSEYSRVGGPRVVLVWIGLYFAVAAILVIWRVKRVSESITTMQHELRRVHDRLDLLDETLRDRVRRSEVPPDPKKTNETDPKRVVS